MPAIPWYLNKETLKRINGTITAEDNIDVSVDRLANWIREVNKIEDDEKRKYEITSILFTIIASKIDNLSPTDLCDLMVNMNLDLKDKLSFFCEAFLICDDDKSIMIGNSTDFFYFPIRELLRERGFFSEEAINALKNDLNIQKKYLLFYKCFDRELVKDADSLTFLLQLPMFKKYVLEDEEFITSNYDTKNINFFFCLPNEFGYLIPYQNPEYVAMSSLFEKYYGDILDEEQLIELLNFYERLQKEENPFGISIKKRFEKLVFVLKQITNNPIYFDELKQIQKKCALTFDATVSLAYTYSKTSLCEDILGKDELTQETIEKIAYLADAKSRPYIQNIGNVEALTLEEIEELDEAVGEEARVSIGGGPASTADFYFYPDGVEKEAIRIDKNGRITRKTYIDAGSEDHVRILKLAYGNDIVYMGRLTQELAEHAAKKLGSISETLENGKCHIYLPENPTLIQKKVCIDLLKTARKGGKVGILIVFDNRVGVYAYTGVEIDIKPAIKYILKIGQKITEAELDKYEIPKLNESETNQQESVFEL